jgi:hypothetical protein
MPISMDRSLEPTSRQSMPGTAPIAAAFSTAFGVSIIIELRLRAETSSAKGILRHG